MSLGTVVQPQNGVESAMDAKKRHKTTRACNHCSKSHMTCSAERPCQRCMQRGLQDTCQDAPRKKKKYLMDVPEALTQPSLYSEGGKTVESVQSPSNQRISGPSTISNNSKYNFLSSAADMEYSTLSNILSDNVMQSDGGSMVLSPSVSTDSEHTGNSNGSSSLGQYPTRKTSMMHSHSHLSQSHSNIPPYISRPSQTPSPQNNYHQTGIYANKPKCDESINQYFLGPTESSNKSYNYPDVIAVINTMRLADPSAFLENEKRSSLSFTIGIIPEDNFNTLEGSQQLHYKEPEEIYAKVKKPFSYTPGYHSLIAYLRQRFPKEMLVKLAKSMAEYRPSFIACTNTLKEEDLIFMEQCFQRTLLTYDNFISVNGTPTIVWRRTGQIAYIGHEFSVLTGWTRDQLLNKITFIVELLDDKSVVEYFELFSKIAFGDFRGATMTECTLLTPNPDIKIRTGCMWTLKRDVFGIPMMIIGNFLPILQ